MLYRGVEQAAMLGRPPPPPPASATRLDIENISWDQMDLLAEENIGAIYNYKGTRTRNGRKKEAIEGTIRCIDHGDTFARGIIGIFSIHPGKVGNKTGQAYEKYMNQEELDAWKEKHNIQLTYRGQQHE